MAKKDLTQKEFLQQLGEYADTLRRTIEANCAAFPVDAKASTARRNRAQGDFKFFCATYFPHYTQVGGKPTGPSALHEWIDTNLPAVADAPEGFKQALAAPRGEAKSTRITLMFVVWCVLTGRKRYIPIITDAFEQAAPFLEGIKVELESNPRLVTDYADHTGPGRIWNVGTIVTKGNVKIQAFGALKRIRGLRHGPLRPDLVILDDLENDENVKSLEQRDKLENWLMSTVLNLGPADDSMDIIYVGTILHHDSVLARTLKKPAWHGKRFQSIIKWPDRMDLWDTWEAIYNDNSEDGGPDAALAYYSANRAAMEAGAVVSWPSYRPLYKLMCKRAESHDAFDSEQQNDPLSTGNAPFASVIVLWTELPSGLLPFGACDPSLGKAGKGRDPSALLVGGLHRDTMRLFTLEALIRKRHPDRIIQDMIALQQRYNCLLWAVETVQFQAFFADVAVQRAIASGTPLPIQPVVNSTDKDLRIETLQPYMAQGRILLHHSQQTLIDQLRHWPKADHDDGPDGLEMLWRVATRGFVSLQDAFIRVPRVAPLGGTVGTDIDEDDLDDAGGFYGPQRWA